MDDDSRISGDVSRISDDASRISRDDSGISDDDSKIPDDDSRISGDDSRIPGDDSRIPLYTGLPFPSPSGHHLRAPEQGTAGGGPWQGLDIPNRSSTVAPGPPPPPAVLTRWQVGQVQELPSPVPSPAPRTTEPATTVHQLRRQLRRRRRISDYPEWAHGDGLGGGGRLARENE